MNKERSAWRVPIVVAAITAAATLGAAVIQSRKADGDVRSKTVIPRDSSDPSTVVATSKVTVPSAKTLRVKGVQIGLAGSEPFVENQQTSFRPGDEIAVTVHYSADDDVRNFPVRMTAEIYGFFGQEVVEATTDVSSPGDSFWTFHLRPEESWSPGKHFLSVKIDGLQAYDQELDVR